MLFYPNENIINTYFHSTTDKPTGFAYLCCVNQMMHMYVYTYMQRPEKYPVPAGAKLHLLQPHLFWFGFLTQGSVLPWVQAEIQFAFDF